MLIACSADLKPVSTRQIYSCDAKQNPMSDNVIILRKNSPRKGRIASNFHQFARIDSPGGKRA